LKEFEVYQLGAPVTDGSSLITRVPVAFVKVVIESGTSRVSKVVLAGGKSSATATAASAKARAASAVARVSTAPTSKASGNAGAAAKGDIDGAVLACTAAKAALPKTATTADKNTACAGAANSYLTTSGSPQYGAVLMAQISLEPDVAQYLGGVKQVDLFKGAAAAASAKTGAVLNVSAAVENLPPGWMADVATGKSQSSETISKGGVAYLVTRTIEAPMYVEMAADNVTPASCYTQLASRSICSDLGGIYTPNLTKKCSIPATSANAPAFATTP
jgi:hypothetical protein